MRSGRGRREIYDVVLGWFKDKERGLVLDVPAGNGFLAKKLKEMGFEVRCGDINPSVFEPKDIECEYMDMTQTIPYSDGTFDYLTCIEGLEHTTNPYRAVSELSRVLKVGGYAVISTPNYCNLEKRLKFLFTGYLTRPKGMEDFRRAKNLYDFHNSPLTVTIIDFMLQINHLKTVGISKDKVKRGQLALFPLYLLLKLIDLFRSDERRRELRSDLTLHRNVILGGNTIIFFAKKVKGAE